MTLHVVTNNIEEPVVFKDYTLAEEYASDLKKRWPTSNVELIEVEEGRPKGHKLVWAAYYCYNRVARTLSTFNRLFVWENEIGTNTSNREMIMGYTMSKNENDCLRECKNAYHR